MIGFLYRDSKSRHIKKRFCFFPTYEIANFFTTVGQSSQKNAHACRISTPRQGEADIR